MSDMDCEVIIGDEVFTVKIKRTRKVQTKGRAYVWGSDVVAEAAMAPIQKDIDKLAAELGLIHPHTQIGMYPDMDKLWKALNKEIVKGQRLVLDVVLWDLGLQQTARWSIRAGCSCPCSPGFILGNLRGMDIFIERVKDEGE